MRSEDECLSADAAEKPQDQEKNSIDSSLSEEKKNTKTLSRTEKPRAMRLRLPRDGKSQENAPCASIAPKNRTELSFLMDLFLCDDLPRNLKLMVSDRIREVEANLLQAPPMPQIPRGTNWGTIPIPAPPLPPLPEPASPVVAQQSPSMQRLMAKHPDLVPQVQVPAPVTPAAAAALQQRASIISRGITTDKPEPGRTSPRKF